MGRGGGNDDSEVRLLPYPWRLDCSLISWVLQTFAHTNEAEAQGRGQSSSAHSGPMRRNKACKYFSIQKKTTQSDLIRSENDTLDLDYEPSERKKETPSFNLFSYVNCFVIFLVKKQYVNNK